jgi:hypothetical protein
MYYNLDGIMSGIRDLQDKGFVYHSSIPSLLELAQYETGCMRHGFDNTFDHFTAKMSYHNGSNQWKKLVS